MLPPLLLAAVFLETELPVLIPMLLTSGTETALLIPMAPLVVRQVVMQ